MISCWTRDGRGRRPRWRAGWSRNCDEAVDGGKVTLYRICHHNSKNSSKLTLSRHLPPERDDVSLPTRVHFIRRAPGSDLEHAERKDVEYA